MPVHKITLSTAMQIKDVVELFEETQLIVKVQTNKDSVEAMFGEKTFAYNKIRPELSDMPDFIDRWMIFISSNDLYEFEEQKYDYDFFTTTTDVLFQDKVDWQSADIKSLFTCKVFKI